MSSSSSVADSLSITSESLNKDDNSTIVPMSRDLKFAFVDEDEEERPVVDFQQLKYEWRIHALEKIVLKTYPLADLTVWGVSMHQDMQPLRINRQFQSHLIDEVVVVPIEEVYCKLVTANEI